VHLTVDDLDFGVWRSQKAKEIKEVRTGLGTDGSRGMQAKFGNVLMTEN
jgi:hypothetical protein